MRRDASRLARSVHDLLVVGGGVHGACVAWDAALRGLSVALVERDDFGAATSANSLRIVHGGLRYLARGDLTRMRESIEERSTLLRIAPQLVEPLAVLVPTRGSGLEGRFALGAAVTLNDLVSLTRNRHLAPPQRIPRSRLLSAKACRRLFPALEIRGVTGGVLWYDAQIRHPERLTLSFVLGAAERGACVMNYAQVERFLLEQGAVCGARVLDRVSGESYDVRARRVVVAAGPWTDDLVARATGAPPGRPSARQAIGLNLVVGRRLAEVAVGLRSATDAADDPVGGGSRFLFLAPQGDTTLLGTWYAVSGEGDLRATIERGAAALMAEFNAICPSLRLSESDVVRRQWGCLPLKSGLEGGRPDALAERPRLIDHAGGGARNLFSVEGVKYTTARRVAEQTVDLVIRDLALPDPGCRTAEVTLPTLPDGMSPAGTRMNEKEILNAVRDEMAVTLADVVFRRTQLGTPPGPDRTAVTEVAHLAGQELGWDPVRQSAEVDDVMRQARLPVAAAVAVR
ncbi:MAG: FAD-dependent oxidoreductase [Gemmatimonadales bacterium]|nr:FAD-dependent oxidoreductase [Gemmatimonadales bacterium]